MDNKVKLSVSVTLFALGVLIHKEPKLFLNFGSFRKWMRYLGEENTIKLMKYVSAPVLILLSIAIFLGFIPQK